jgi:penicillin G amidase
MRDAFFAQGFVHAQDRLWQMEWDRRRAAGRMAETIGSSGLTYDIFVRRLDVLSAARADYDALDDEARIPLDRYADGVNAAIESMPELPWEFRTLGVTPDPWEGWQCAAVLKVRHVLMSTIGSKLWRARLAQVLSPEAMTIVGAPGGRDDLLIVPPGEWAANELDPADVAAGWLALDTLAEGSNNWVVHGSRTASGAPLLAGDPHRALEVPGVYYQNHLLCDEFDAIGFSMPGTPGMFHFGHNATAAWCITHAMADGLDLFVERFASDGRYEFKGEYLAAQRHRETIQVRDGDPHTIEVVRTHHGPITFGDPASGSAMALRWTGTDVANRSLGAILPILRARTVADLDEAMRDWVDPCNSVLMADTQGSIGYLHRGRSPIRPSANGWLPVPGWDGEHEWNGDVPFEELPRLRDPESGFIVTANNRVVGPDYPYYLAMDYAAPNRARRIFERLQGLRGARAEDMAAIHADRVSLSAPVFVQRIAKIQTHTELAASAREHLLAWDGSMDKDAAAPVIFAAAREALAELLLQRAPLQATVGNPFPEEPLALPAIARVRSALARLIAADDRSVLDGATWEELLALALERACATLRAELGDDVEEWRWDRVHVTRIRHPLARVFPEHAELLNPPPVALAGDGDTPLAGSADIGLGVLHSSVARYVFDLGDWERSAWVVPLGSSGDPNNPHYADQRHRWSDVELFPMTYAWERVEAAAVSTQTLEPK